MLIYSISFSICCLTIMTYTIQHHVKYSPICINISFLIPLSIGGVFILNYYYVNKNENTNHLQMNQLTSSTYLRKYISVSSVLSCIYSRDIFIK